MKMDMKMKTMLTSTRPKLEFDVFLSVTAFLLCSILSLNDAHVFVSAQLWPLWLILCLLRFFCYLLSFFSRYCLLLIFTSIAKLYVHISRTQRIERGWEMSGSISMDENFSSMEMLRIISKAFERRTDFSVRLHWFTGRVPRA